MERNQKNIEKTKKSKQKKKYLETLGGTPPSPRPLEYCFFFLLCANPSHPQDLWNIVFFCFLDAFVGLCHSPPSPRPLEYIFFLFVFFCFATKSNCFMFSMLFLP